MPTQNKNTFTKNPATEFAIFRESALFDVSRNDPDIYQFIKDGLLLIPASDLTEAYSEEIGDQYILRSYLIQTFFLKNAKDFRDSNGDITVRLFSVEFDPETEVFRGLATLSKPHFDEFFLNSETRELIFSNSLIVCIEKSHKAARDAIKEIEMDES